jgi:hypothetical protein
MLLTHPDKHQATANAPNIPFAGNCTGYTDAGALAPPSLAH